MKSLAFKLAGTFALLIVPLVLALLPRADRYPAAFAQVGGGTALPATVTTVSSVAICGGITSFTAATSSTAGSITFSTANVTNTYPILAGVTLSGQSAISTSGSFCLSGTLNAAGSLTNGVITANVTTPIVVCGPVTAYTPATSSALGSLTIAGITFNTALGTTFTGSPVTVGANLCISLQLSSLGNILSGLAVVNTSGALSLTGPFTTFTPPTATTNGSVTFGIGIELIGDKVVE
jgi:hypothetical protein